MGWPKQASDGESVATWKNVGNACFCAESLIVLAFHGVVLMYMSLLGEVSSDALLVTKEASTPARWRWQSRRD